MKYNLIFLSVLFFCSKCISAQESAGKTIMAHGKVAAHQVLDEKKIDRLLKRRSAIYAIDVITTGPESQAQFSMVDGGLIALKENSILDIKDYKFNYETKKGSASIELLKGGLRSISGAIKKNGGDYKIDTPVGSIGIRGTHFEIQLVSKNLYLAVWDGAIDVTLINNEVLSLGNNEAYSFANITSSGEINRMLEPAALFADTAYEVTSKENETSETSDIPSQSSEAEDTGSQATKAGDNNNQTDKADDDNMQTVEPTDSDSNSSSTSQTSQDAPVSSQKQSSTDDQPISNETTISEAEIAMPLLGNTEPDEGYEFIQPDITESETELEIVDTPTAEIISEDRFQGDTQQSIVDLISQREGVFTYQANSFNVLSTQGEISDFSMFMSVDFDNGTVPSGEINFKDEGGEWFATYNGLINVSELELGITFGSHGNNTVEGDINAIFIDGIDTIKGEFDLREKLNPSVSAGGSFELKD